MSVRMIKITTFAALAASLVGCQKDMSDLHNTVAQINARPPGIIEPIPEQQPYISFKYPQHDRDPFNWAVLEPDKKKEAKKVDKGVPIDLDRPPELLEAYPLDSLKYVGTVTKNNAEWALIRTPNEMIHSVKRGNYVGQNYGKIVDITDRNLYLQETVKNGLGGYKYRDNSVEISQ